MSTTQQLTEQFTAFNEALMAFVESCTDADWPKVTQAEGWPVGVTAHHVGAMHYPVAEWAYLIATAQPTPDITMAVVDQLNAQHVRESERYTQAEVLDFLRGEAAKAIQAVADLSDGQWASTDYVRVLDTQISAAHLFTKILLDSAYEHLASMKATREGVA